MRKMKALGAAFIAWLLTVNVAFAQPPVIWGPSGNAKNIQNSTTVGTGKGPKNYLEKSTNTVSGWTASGAGVTLSTTTTTADLPSVFAGSGLKILRASGSTDYAYTTFTVDPSDYGKKLQLSFDVKPGGSYVASDFKVDVYSCTIAWSATTCSGTSARLGLSTDSSTPATLLANATGTISPKFDVSSSATFIMVRLGLNASTSGTSIVVSDVYAGPGITTQDDAFVFVQHNATQALSSVTLAPVLFNTEALDQTNVFASNVLTVAKAGVYSCTFFGALSRTSGTSVAGDVWNINFQKNGTAVGGSGPLQYDMALTNGIYYPFSISALISASVGDVIRAAIVYNAGGGHTWVGTLNGANMTCFSK